MTVEEAQKIKDELPQYHDDAYQYILDKFGLKEDFNISEQPINSGLHDYLSVFKTMTFLGKKKPEETPTE